MPGAGPGKSRGSPGGRDAARRPCDGAAGSSGSRDRRAGKPTAMTSEPTVNDATFWQDLYAQGGDRWELGRPSPSLGAHLARRPPPLGTVAVPGCGRGHDARLLARRGYRVLGFDFVPGTVRTARELAEREGVPVIFEE